MPKEQKADQSNEILRALLANGYFPTELPPPFTSAKYADACVEQGTKWEADGVYKFVSSPESYSIPRFLEIRRKLSLVNPINQFRVARLISQNWDEVREKLDRSKTSEFTSKLRLSGSGRPIEAVNFSKVDRARVRILGGYGAYLKTDIARFYPSIYTHSLPWSLYGKEYCKENRHQKDFKNKFGDKIDKAVRDGQSEQTIGISIGPDTSRILSELIMCSVEDIVKEKLIDFDSRSFRYVDDFLIAINPNEAPSEVIAALSVALYEFELEVNAEKTEILGLGHPHNFGWAHELRAYEVSRYEKAQVTDIDSFFEKTITLADQNPRANVALYSSKVAATFRIMPENEDHRAFWLLHLARRYPSSLPFVIEFLILRSSQEGFPRSIIEKFVVGLIPSLASRGHIHELSWLLFAVRELNIKIDAKNFSDVVRLRSSVVALLTFDLWHRGQIDGPVDFKFWRSFANADGLRSEMWLVAYECSVKGWWDQKLDTSYVTDCPFFGGLWGAGVEFYDVKKGAAVLAKPLSSMSRSELIAAFGLVSDGPEYGLGGSGSGYPS
jgi:hypothetical protein